MLFEARTAPRACQACHAGLNGIGFGFEHYDAAGRFITQQNGLPIDATGSLHGTDVDRTYDGAIELSEILAGSATVEACAAQQWLRYALGRAPETQERPVVDALQRVLHERGDLRELLVAIVTAPTFRMRKLPEAPR
jgi:hypothetical protein